MNRIWTYMLFLGIAFALGNGRLSEFSDAVFSGCTDAIYFVIGIAGIMAVWSGLMNIAKESGLIDLIARVARPMMRFLFPGGIGDEASTMILMSFTANLFGAGNSATVFSIKAMERLDAENHGSRTASNAMCMFMGVSMSMVQLVPITVIKIRSDMGSVNATDIILPSIAAGLVSMICSIALCKLYERKS